MSMYYTMYFVYKKEDKFYPIGPYTKNGKLLSVSAWSRSFMSNLIDDFRGIEPKDFSNDLFNVLLKSDKEEGYGYHDFNEFMKEESNMLFGSNFLVCPLDTIKRAGVNNGIVQGYMDRETVNQIERNKLKGEDDYVEVSEYDFVMPTVYASMDKDEQKQYCYYAMQLTDSKSYQASLLTTIWSAMEFDLRYESNNYSDGIDSKDCYVLCMIA